ncbi:hypothetical protein [Gluconobacter potus]|uniref:hypothetical protein n=1 Tax=Gluconobacter potus TaxID=2724927 RepID=UPI0039EB39F4
MVKVYKFPINKSEIQSLPDEDRRILLLGGHALNQIGMWFRLITISTNEDGGHPVSEHLRASQTHMLLRSLYSCLHETWIWLKKDATKKHLEGLYLPKCSPEAVAAYDSIREIFDGSSHFGKIRNQYSSHFPNRQQIETAFNYASEQEDWSWYMCNELTNSFWGSSEVVIGYGAIELAGKENAEAGLKYVISQAMEISNNFQDFITEVLRLIWSGHSEFEKNPEIYEIPECPSGQSFELPFLFEPPFGSSP